jgi:serine-type D-Ala-D-Ala carboxypeptidase/endopeptidase (penicillin-binding protein 4)
MARRDRGRPGPLARWLPVVLVLAVLAGAAATYHFELGERWFGTGTPSGPTPDPTTEPAAVPAPEGVVLPSPTPPPAVARAVPAADEGAMAPRRVARLLKRLLVDPDLGKHVVALVTELGSGATVFEQGGQALPASTTKLLTTTAALHVLGGDHRFTTSAVLEGQGKRRRLVLVGGGDPYLLSKPDHDPADQVYPPRADVRTLARKVADALGAEGIHRVRLGYDDSLFTGPDASVGWESSYLPDGVVAPIRALWVDEGRPADGSGRVADPSLTAATYFAAELGAAGLVVTGRPTPHLASAGATTVAEVQSAPLSQIVERVLSVSDNEAAEVLGHQVGLATVGRGSFQGGVAGVEQVLAELGVPLQGAVLYDGSGLSRDNRLDPATLVAVLRLAAADDHPELRPVLTGLPVAGFTGSLEYRFTDTAPPARGRVRAKTGTLTGVSALAGVATDLDGTSVAFVLVADRVALVKTLAAREALDAAAAAIAGCHCSR